MRSTIRATATLLIGAILGALGMLPWINGEGAPIPEGTELRFEVAEPDWSWWPVSAPKCPPLITSETPPAKSL